jgi:hypothetical protein
LEVDSQPEKVVIHTVRENKYEHERRSDRVRSMFLDFDTFNNLPDHVSCLGIGAFTNSSQVISLADVAECFLVTRYVDGELYVKDLHRIADKGTFLPKDRKRALVLAHPTWYPNLKESTREILFNFIENILGVKQFDPQMVNAYLRVDE